MKDKAEKTINKYLPSLNVVTRPVKLQNLPLVYRGFYDFEEIEIYDKAYLVIKVKDKALGPKDFKKHSKVLKEKLDYPQIWYLKDLHFNKVQRMIENELNFVIKDKHVYLPSINVSIKAEVEKKKTNTELSGLSINILIREILEGDLSGLSKVEIAKLLDSTKMTTGRAIEPLLANELCEEQKVGVSKKIHFKSRNKLWEYIREEVGSPIKEVIYINKIPKLLFYSGISALSKMSMLAEDNLPVFAAEKKAFNKKYSNTEPVLKEFAMAKVELWDRQPILQESDCINLIDLYLVLKNENDERILIELEELLSKHNLKVGHDD